MIHAEDTNGAAGARFAIFKVNVEVIDLNDNTPTFSKPQYTLDVPEDTSLGTTVFTFLASDPDDGNNGLVTYSLLFSNCSELWILNSTSGALSLNG